uniref:Myofilin n=1 Tax=Clastoptera arizonana TaxID=38151 RepID=A0A1B6DF25_9HEMI
MVLLRQHLDLIGRNEPIQRKAKFWQSYVRALKGTDDMKAPDATHYSRPRGFFRPLLSDYSPFPKSIYEDPIHAGDRITVPGYRYMPVSRETYGISPRNIYPHHYSSSDRFPSRPGTF